MGSRGSVIPVFKEQKSTGKVTVTDERMSRFWLTLDQGVRFVIRQIDNMVGGEVFVPKIPSMKIIDLARAVAPECRVEFVGIRPGEKVHEVLISSDEARLTVEFEDMFVVRPMFRWSNRLKNWDHGSQLPEGFEYSSDKNTEWISIDQMKKLFGDVQQNLVQNTCGK